MTQEELLLAEARRMYPVGTKFVPAHMGGRSDSSYCIVTDDSTFTWNDGDPDITLKIGKKAYIQDSKGLPSKYGNTEWNRCVYHNGIWAKRLGLPIQQQLPIFN